MLDYVSKLDGSRYYTKQHKPVGDDQKQHLELARDMAKSLTKILKEIIFSLPEPLIQKNFLSHERRDGTKMMSDDWIIQE